MELVIFPTVVVAPVVVVVVVVVVVAEGRSAEALDRSTVEAPVDDLCRLAKRLLQTRRS